MKDFLINLIKLLLSLVVILFIEEYFYKALGLVGLTVTETPTIKLIIYILEFIVIYFLYRKEIKSAFSKYQAKMGSNILNTVISYIVIFIAMMIVNYIVKLIAANLNINYSGLNYVNIFNQNFNYDLVVLFITTMLIIPFVKVTIFVLGVDNLFKGKIGVVLSGLLYAHYEGFLIGGNFGHVFIDVIDEFFLFVMLSYVYRKNSNIAYSILTYILYVLFSALLITRIA